MAVTAKVCNSSSGPKKTSAFSCKAVEHILTTFGVVQAPEFLGNWKEVKEGCE